MTEQKAPYLGDDSDRFISAADVAKRLNKHEKTVLRLARNGIIPVVVLGRNSRLFHWPSVRKALLNLQTGIS